jgi:hypothetical protein
MQHLQAIVITQHNVILNNKFDSNDVDTTCADKMGLSVQVVPSTTAIPVFTKNPRVSGKKASDSEQVGSLSEIVIVLFVHVINLNAEPSVLKQTVVVAPLHPISVCGVQATIAHVAIDSVQAAIAARDRFGH